MVRACLDAWMASLDADTFTKYLPVFRGVLSELDKTEKRRLMDAIFGRVGATTGREPIPGIETDWENNLADLSRLLNPRANP